MDFTRAKALGSIQRDQRASTQTLEWREYAVCLDRFEKQRIEHARRRTVQHFSDMGIRRDVCDAEQGLAVGPAVPLFQTALMAQEGPLPMKNTANADRPMSAMVY